MTLLVDAFSRRILAVFVTFDEPSYRSCMMVLRLCVQRHGRLPQIIVVDNGPEFNSTWFDTTPGPAPYHQEAASARQGPVRLRV